jgi:outer membrane immunogenic protein
MQSERAYTNLAVDTRKMTTGIYHCFASTCIEKAPFLHRNTILSVRSRKALKSSPPAGFSPCPDVQFRLLSLLENNVKRLVPVTSLIILALVAAGSASAQSFAGFYFGGYAGGSVNQSVAQTTTVFSASGYFANTSIPAIATAGKQSFAPEAITGGGQVGWNFQWGHFVIGPEVDFGSLRLNAAASSTAGYPCCSPTTFTVNQSIKTRGLFTARARGGVAFGRLYLYGTGGVGITNFSYQEVFTDTFANATENGGAKVDKAGWVVGGGGEVALSKHFSMKGEFLYINFGTVTNTSTNLVSQFIDGPITAGGPPPTTAWPQNPFTHTATLSEKMGRFGVNFRF